MNIRTLLASIIVALLIGLAVFNWQALATPVNVSLGFSSVVVPLGLVLALFVATVVAVCLGYLLKVGLHALSTSRRHATELRTERERADNAEASRMLELRLYLEHEIPALGQLQRASEQHLGEQIVNATNALAASIGEIDERLERHFPVSQEKQP